METKQKYNFKLGEPVLYRCLLDAWRIALWGGVETHDSVGNIRDVIEVIPLEGNEHMHGTQEDLKPQRWRAYSGEKYFYIDCIGSINSSIEDYTSIDDARYKIGNYFETEDDAKLAAQKIINALKE